MIIKSRRRIGLLHRRGKDGQNFRSVACIFSRAVDNPHQIWHPNNVPMGRGAAPQSFCAIPRNIATARRVILPAHMKAPLHYRDPPQRSPAAIVGAFTGNICGNGCRREAFYAPRRQALVSVPVILPVTVAGGNGLRRRPFSTVTVLTVLGGNRSSFYRLNYQSTFAGGKRCCAATRPATPIRG